MIAATKAQQGERSSWEELQTHQCEYMTYALLFGAGISRSAHIPSGWEIEDKLTKTIEAATQGVTNMEDWHQWYKDKYGYSASYSSLLEALVKTPIERVQLISASLSQHPMRKN